MWGSLWNPSLGTNKTKAHGIDSLSFLKTFRNGLSQGAIEAENQLFLSDTFSNPYRSLRIGSLTGDWFQLGM